MQINQLAQGLQAHWRCLLKVHIAFVLLGIAALTPLFAASLQALLALSGREALADQDIAMVLLSPGGMAAGILLGGLWLGLFALELAALLAVVRAGEQGVKLSPAAAIRFALGRTPALLRLATLLALRLLLWLVPFTGLAAVIAWSLLRQHDINYYLAQHPPEFILAVGLVGGVLLVLAWVLGRRLLNWCLALPILLFSRRGAAGAFTESTRLIRHREKEAAATLLAWLLLALLLSLAPALLLALGTKLVMTVPTQQLTPLVLLLGGIALLWLALNLLVSALILGSLCLAISDLHKRCAPSQVSTGPFAGQAGEPQSARQAAQQPSERRWHRPGAVTATVMMALLSVSAGLMLLRGIQFEDQVTIIAHRGAAGAAPENTLAAVRRAVVDGTDWVEIDVQETRDGHIVVVHDSDFMKLAGQPLKVWEGDLADIRLIDVGSWFDPAFADQRPPLLAEVLEEVRGRARLVIELKYYGHDVDLERRVVEVVEAAGMEDQVVVMSLKLPGVRKLKQLRPDWAVGLLVATAVGDLTRLDVDFLAVNSGMANPRFVRRARTRGMPLYVWTVNDAVSLSTWMSRGVNGIITDEPALARRVLRERAGLSTVERLLLSAATFFGKPGPIKDYRDNSP